jgi:cytochrome c peroxidase
VPSSNPAARTGIYRVVSGEQGDMQGFLVAALGLVLAASAAAAGGAFDAAERARIEAHGPWPPAARADPSNRVSQNPHAAALGRRLFSNPSLSGAGTHSCASCHSTWRHFTDGKPRGVGAATAERNTQGLFNVAQQRWFGWDGGHATLWAQSLRPLLDPREMRSSAARVASVVRADDDLAAMYRQAFGAPLPVADDALLVDVGMALAAFQETLVSGRTPFDAYRDALSGVEASAVDYPDAAQSGLKLFVGKAGCATCHSGPLFSDGELHRTRVASSAREGRGPLFIRTPGLRDVGATGPYMHDGSVASLCDAIRWHAGPRQVVLTRAERSSLLAFLRTLGSEAEPVFADARTWQCGGTNTPSPTRGRGPG